jgi:hypothetical protein
VGDAGGIAVKRWAFLRFACAGLGAALHLLGAPHADAQSVAGHAKAERSESSSSPPALAEEVKEFAFLLKLPAFYSTSVVPSNADGSGVEKPDWRFSPEAVLRWSRQFSDVRLTASAALILDRYRQVTSADLNTLEGTLKAFLTDGRSDLFVPYASLIATTFYDRDFKSLDDRRQEVAIGFYSGLGFRGGQALAYRSVKKPEDRGIRLDLQIGYRFANDSNIEHLFVDGIVDFIYVLRPDLSFVVSPKVRARWYSDYFGASREDLRVGAKALLAWEPEWLVKALPGSELQFSVEYLRNFSNEPSVKYSLWEVGPTIALKAKF